MVHGYQLQADGELHQRGEGGERLPQMLVVVPDPRASLKSANQRKLVWHQLFRTQTGRKSVTQTMYKQVCYQILRDANRM
jgi:hypothetical protein